MTDRRRDPYGDWLSMVGGAEARNLSPLELAAVPAPEHVSADWLVRHLTELLEDAGKEEARAYDDGGLFMVTLSRGTGQNYAVQAWGTREKAVMPTSDQRQVGVLVHGEAFLEGFQGQSSADHGAAPRYVKRLKRGDVFATYEDVDLRVILEAEAVVLVIVPGAASDSARGARISDGADRTASPPVVVEWLRRSLQAAPGREESRGTR